MTGEEWRPVVDYEGRYEVSSEGRLRSWVGRFSRQRSSPYYFKCGANAVGYAQVQLRDRKNATHFFTIHRLVLAAFVGPCPTDHEVRHLNGDRLDNRLENLRYGTHSENVRDAIAHGTHNQSSKTHCLRDHEFTPENTRITRRGSRECRACRSDYFKTYQRKAS